MFLQYYSVNKFSVMAQFRCELTCLALQAHNCCFNSFKLAFSIQNTFASKNLITNEALLSKMHKSRLQKPAKWLSLYQTRVKICNSHFRRCLRNDSWNGRKSFSACILAGAFGNWIMHTPGVLEMIYEYCSSSHV